MQRPPDTVLIESGLAVLAGALLVAWRVEAGPVVGAIAASGATMFGLGLGLWLRSGSEGERAAKRRKLLRRAALFLVLALLLGGSALGLYMLAWKRADASCRQAMALGTLEERGVATERALGRWRWVEVLLKKKLVSTWCGRALHEIDAHRTEALCPAIIPPVLSCRCGAERWPKELGCARVATCWYEDESFGRTLRLRCLGPERFAEFGFE